MERKLGEVHEMETLGQRRVRESGSETQWNAEKETKGEEQEKIYGIHAGSNEATSICCARKEVKVLVLPAKVCPKLS